MQKLPHIYSMPELFLADHEVPARWRVLAVINGFFLNQQKCWASNEWIAERLGSHKDTVSKAIKELEELEFLRCERTRRTRLISPVFREIGVSAYLRSASAPISDRRQRLSNSVSNSEKNIAVSKKTAPSEDSGEESPDVIIDRNVGEDGEDLPVRMGKPIKPNKKMHDAAMRVTIYFQKKSSAYTGKTVLITGYSHVRDLMENKHLTEEQLKKFIDDFFEETPTDSRAANIFICLALRNLNKRIVEE